MILEIIKTFKGDWVITDAEDENAPMISLHNEYNTEAFAVKLLKLLTKEK